MDEFTKKHKMNFTIFLCYHRTSDLSVSCPYLLYDGYNV